MYVHIESPRTSSKSCGMPQTLQKRREYFAHGSQRSQKERGCGNEMNWSGKKGWESGRNTKAADVEGGGIDCMAMKLVSLCFCSLKGFVQTAAQNQYFVHKPDRICSWPFEQHQSIERPLLNVVLNQIQKWVFTTQAESIRSYHDKSRNYFPAVSDYWIYWTIWLLYHDLDVKSEPWLKHHSTIM